MTTRVVVVGAGSAGAVLAARLSERPSIDVLLLEAGPDYRTADTPPGMQSPNPGRVLDDTHRYTWPGLVARRTASQAPRRYWRGRGAGGTSAVNGQIAIRPGPEDFDAKWPEGWHWADVLPAFIRLESDVDFGAEAYHGVAGPIPIHRAPLERWEAVDLALRAGASALGHPECADHNAPTGTGISPFAINSDDGVRVSTNDAYLEPARARPNLQVVGDALVDRVLYGSGSSARGVRVRIQGSWQDVEADVVLLAAGAVHTPAILLRSGVGPADDLRHLGIGLEADLPVGRSLMEHPIAYVVLRLRDEGRASSVDARHTNCTVRYSSGLAGGGRNDLMLIGNNLAGGTEKGRSVGILGVALEESFSHGSVRLASPDPDADPVLDLAMLSDERDLVRMRDGVARLVELARQPAVGAIAEGVTAGARTPLDELRDEQALDRWLGEEVTDGNHAAASCPMGSVLDPDCGVHGVANLHVVDASSFPTITAANPHLAVIMLGEVMAERLGQRLG